MGMCCANENVAQLTMMKQITDMATGIAHMVVAVEKIVRNIIDLSDAEKQKKKSEEEVKEVNAKCKSRNDACKAAKEDTLACKQRRDAAGNYQDCDAKAKGPLSGFDWSAVGDLIKGVEYFAMAFAFPRCPVDQVQYDKQQEAI